MSVFVYLDSGVFFFFLIDRSLIFGTGPVLSQVKAG